MDNEVSSSNYLSFSFLGLIIKRHLKLILSSIVFVAISSFITYGVMRPKYTSTTDLLVNQKLSKVKLQLNHNNYKQMFREFIPIKILLKSCYSKYC